MIYNIPLGSASGILYNAVDRFDFTLATLIYGNVNAQGHLTGGYFAYVGPVSVRLHRYSGGSSDASDIIDYSHPPLFFDGRKTAYINYPYNLSKYGNYASFGVPNVIQGTITVPPSINIGTDIS